MPDPIIGTRQRIEETFDGAAPSYDTMMMFKMNMDESVRGRFKDELLDRLKPEMQSDGLYFSTTEIFTVVYK